VTIHYNRCGDNGDNVALLADDAAKFLADPAFEAEVRAMAQRNVVATGRACDVFADDKVTLLVRARPTP
jgi:hypothetical protein